MGVVSVSAQIRLTSSTSMPSTSATLIASTESDPWPMSICMHFAVTPPPRSTFRSTDVCGILFQ